MRTRKFDGTSSERGGITILVVLMLLVLLTIAAVGMSRNAFREVVASGTSRQGAMARNTADSGIEWSIYWVDPINAASATGTAKQLWDLKTALLQDSTLAGKAYDLMSVSPTAPTDYAPASAGTALTLASVTTASGGTIDQSLTAGLTRMGKLPIADQSQGSGPGAFTPAQGTEVKQAPDLWAVRTDAQIAAGSTTFVHSKEVWISTPIQQ